MQFIVADNSVIQCMPERVVFPSRQHSSGKMGSWLYFYDLTALLIKVWLKVQARSLSS